MLSYMKENIVKNTTDFIHRYYLSTKFKLFNVRRNQYFLCIFTCNHECVVLRMCAGKVFERNSMGEEAHQQVC